MASSASAVEIAAAPATAQSKVTALYEERGAELLHFALALARDEELAKDALQECFLRYFMALCEGEEIASPRAWIYRVLHNYLLDRLKETRYTRARAIQTALSVRGDREIERDCFRQELMRLGRTALSPREYKCLHLRTEGLRYEEIAATLHLTSGTVGALISRAIGKLRRILIASGGEDK